ncbi:TPA: hypothetical protein NKX82_001835 [Vibrio parahaemolyticus]|nr:hypothetical protein [Vibrio parahaemolyticus]
MLLLVNFLLFLFYVSQLKRSIFILLPIYYHFVTCYTLLGSKYYDFSEKVPFDFYLSLNDESISYMAYTFSIAAFFFFIGVLFTSNFREKSVGLDFNKARYILSKLSSIKILSIYLFVILCLHIGHGVSHIYSREGYLIGDAGNKYFRIIYSSLLPVSLMLLPFLKNKALRMTLFIALFFLVFGTSSRNIILIPVSYCFGVLIRDNKIGFLRGGGTVASVVILSAAALQYRFNQFQGVIPNAIEFFTNGINMDFVFLAINYLSSFSFFASALTVQNFPLDMPAFYSSINPLPSSFIDVEHMIAVQKLNQNAPFPAIGTLAQGGVFFVSIYYFLLGFCWSKFAGDLIKRSKIIAFFVYVFFLLFMVLSIQYNLRSVTRYIYYILFFSMIFKVFRIIIFNLRQHEKSFK